MEIDALVHWVPPVWLALLVHTTAPHYLHSTFVLHPSNQMKTRKCSRGTNELLVACQVGESGLVKVQDQNQCSIALRVQ